MAAPFRQLLPSRILTLSCERSIISSRIRTNKYINGFNLRRLYTSNNGRNQWHSKSKVWYVGAVGAGVIAAGVLKKLVSSDWQAVKVYAEDEVERPSFRVSRRGISIAVKILGLLYKKDFTLPFKSNPQVQVDTDHSGLKLTLYQFQTCPFCCKVRAALDYHGFSYDVIEVNSVTKKQIKWAEYPKVPILVVETPGAKEVILKDSSAIISVLESYLYDRSTSVDKYWSYYPCYTEKISGRMKYDFPNRYFVMFQDSAEIGSTPKERNEERKWRRWADDHLVHMLSPNVYRTVGEALQAFHYFSDVGDWEQNFSYIERQIVIYVGAAVMYVMGMILKARYRLKDDVRQSLYDACNEWVKAMGKDNLFMGGSQPNLGDLAVYGVLNSIEGCTAFQDALKNTKIGPWYNRTKLAVQNHQGSHPLNTKILPSDQPK